MAVIDTTTNQADSPSAQTADTQARPNVLFISVDDLNDWVGVLGGYPGVKTPNIDRLAQQGTLFTHAYSPIPVCNGARTSVMTGLTPDATGVYYNKQDWRAAVPNVVTLPEHFMQNGYEAVGAGKLFHGGFEKPEAFNQYFTPSGPHNFKPSNPPQPPFWLGHGPSADPQEEVNDFQTTEFATNYLNQEHTQPFFLGVGIFKPHESWVVPQEYFDLYPIEEVVLPNVKQNDFQDIPEAGKDLAGRTYHRKVVESGEWPEVVQAYLASISYADAMIGKVLDALNNSPHADNTIVVLWSDHGQHIGEKLHWGKSTLWEEATHIPMIIAAPGVGQPAQVSQRPVSSLDLYPTLVELTGVSERSELQGASLVPLLQNPQQSWERPAISTWEYSHSARTEQWRYIRHYDGTEELYDHQSDPNEFTNLASEPEYASIKAELAATLPAPRNTIVGTPAADDVLTGTAGDDILIGDIGDKTIYGHSGDKSGNDTLYGGRGNDRLDGRGGDDLLRGGSGDDTLEAWRGADLLKGGAGNDTLRGHSNVTFEGGSGNDVLITKAGGSTLKGGLGSDTLQGGKQNDILQGGKGDDLLTGGGGQDKFVVYQGNGTDIITDFQGAGGTSPEAEVDILEFEGAWAAGNKMLQTQEGSDVHITFGGIETNKIILQDIALDELGNLQFISASTSARNNLLNGYQVQNSVDVFSAESSGLQ